MSNELIEALKQILGWRELRSGSEFPMERIEEIARDAIENAALQPTLPQEPQVPIVWARQRDINATMIATRGERAEVAPDKEPGFTVPLYLHPPAEQPSLPQDAEEWIADRPTYDDGSHYISERDLRAFLAGKVLVPVEPTKEMVVAGHHAAWRRIPSIFDFDDAENVYKAMLTASKGE